MAAKKTATASKKAGKDNQIMFRLSDEDKEALEQAAKVEDRTLSDWVRYAVRSRLRDLGLLPKLELPDRPKQ